MNEIQRDAIGLGLSGLRTTDALKLIEAAEVQESEEQDTLETWSDAAREAAAEARRHAGKIIQLQGDKTGQAAKVSTIAAGKTSALAEPGAKESEAAHVDASAAHEKAAKLHSSIGHTFTAERHNRLSVMHLDRAAQLGGEKPDQNTTYGKAKAAGLFKPYGPEVMSIKK